MAPAYSGMDTMVNQPTLINHNATTPVVYFLQSSDDDTYSNLRIKVGHTKCFTKRLREHQQSKLGSRQHIEPLAVVAGTKNNEGIIKRYFASLALDGEEEVFRPDTRIVDYIRWLRDHWYVWVPEDGDSPDHLTTQDSSMWLPTDTRRKAASTGVLAGFNGPLNLSERIFTADDFYTSERIIAVVNKLFGRVDLDPASHALANRVIKAKRIYTKEDDGLVQQWSGKVWCNPPFSNWKEWAPKIVSEWKSGRVEEMCVLSACRTLTAQQFSPIIQDAVAICILFGRIPFWGMHATSSPDDGHVIFYFGRRVESFVKCFGTLGTTFLSSTGNGNAR